MVRVVRKEGTLGAGVGGNRSSGMDGSMSFSLCVSACIREACHIKACQNAPLQLLAWVCMWFLTLGCIL